MRKIISTILSLILILGIFSFSAYALTEGDYTYTVTNGEATITRYLGSESHLVIPDTLGGYPVVKIGMTAFKANRSIISVVVPTSVTTLADRAFANCYNLEEITIPYETITIGKYCFENTNIHTVYCGEGSVAEEYFEENYGGVDTKLFPKLTKKSAQVKMKITGENTVDNHFDFRVISSISETDWNNWFANTGDKQATTNCITLAGIVAYRGVNENYNLEIAKQIAINNTSNDSDYGVATTDYICKRDGEVATFGAIVRLNHETIENDVVCLTFIKYLDQYGEEKILYLDNTYTAPIVSKYDEIVVKYIAQWG